MNESNKKKYTIIRVETTLKQSGGLKTAKKKKKKSKYDPSRVYFSLYDKKK